MLLVLPVAFAGCTLKDEGSNAATDGPPQIPPPSDVAAPPANAIRTASGIAYKVLTVGLGGVHPTPRHKVRVHYTGWTTDGKMFDSSVQRGSPIEMGVSNFIPGWIEMLQLMVAGEKVRTWIPAQLAYEGQPTRPQGMLVFDIELLEIK